MYEGHKNWKMVGPKKIMFIILGIQLMHVHSEEQSSKDGTKLITFAKILLHDLAEHITFVDRRLVHLNQLPETEVNDFIKNHDLHNEGLKQVENKLHLLQTNLTELTSLPLDGEEDITTSKTKSVALNNEFDQLNRELDKFRVYRSLPLLYDFKKIDELLEKYNNLVAEKIEIHKKIEDKEQTQLVDNCVSLIELRQFQRAAEIFDLVKDDNKIIDIVNRGYEVEDGDYYLLEIGININNLNRTYLFFKALFNKLHNDKEQSRDVIIHYFKHFELLKIIHRELLDQPIIDPDLKAKAAELLKDVKLDIVNLGVKALTNEVLDRGIRTAYFLERPLIFDYEIVGKICYQTIVDTHKQHSNDLRDTLNLVFSEITKKYEGNVMHFGQFIKYLETKLKGSVYESSLQLDLASVKAKLPNIVRNILYSEEVCIKQDGLDMYLRQARHIDNDAVKSYAVYIGPQRYKPEERWQLIHVHGDEYIIKNIAHGYSLDVVTASHTCGEKTIDHKVITTNNKQQNNIWKIEVTNDYAYLKNTANNEYLYASREITSSDAATNTFTGIFSNAFQWHILNCSSVPLRE